MAVYLLLHRTNRYFFTTVAFLPLLSAAKTDKHSSCVINISSVAGQKRNAQHHFAYAVSKAAVIQLNALLARELTQPGVHIRVNSIAPGLFPSRMTSAL